MWPGPRSTTVPGGILIHPAIWPQQTLAKNWDGAVPLWGGGSPSNTMWPRQRPTSIPSDILIHPAVWPQQTWAKNWGCCATILGGKLGHHATQCGMGRGLPLYQVASLSMQPFGHNTCTKIGRVVPPFLGEGERGTHLTQCHLGQGLPLHQVASQPIQPFGHNWHGPKIRGSCAPFGERSPGFPCNTMWMGLRPTYMPSFILIRPPIWPQYTNVTDRTDRHNGLIA